MVEHPCGAGPLVGCQLRYLIHSAHGWLGGFGFSSAARRVQDRDAWIGWDGATRQAQLHRVLCMSRFLLRPRGCRNLASHVLGQVLQCVAHDFERSFGYRPYLLESFVDTSRFDGVCYRAVNFLRVGETRGRGRQDRGHAHDKTIKDLHVYPLVADFRQRMGVVAPPACPPLAVGEGLDSSQWAAQEFGNAPLGDQRLSQRLVASAAHLAVTVRSCRYFGPEVAAARRSVRPVPDRACGSASVRANRVAMRFQCPTPFLTLAITPLRSASIAIWQALRTAPYRHDRTVTSGHATGAGLHCGIAKRCGGHQGLLPAD